jgi:hypothetical protein
MNVFDMRNICIPFVDLQTVCMQMKCHLQRLGL